jgi:predicted DNA-binding protein
MPISVRLDSETEQRLQRMASRTGRTKSDLVREAIVRLDEALEPPEDLTLYERLREYIGVADLGPRARAERSEEVLQEEGFGRKPSR